METCVDSNEIVFFKKCFELFSYEMFAFEQCEILSSKIYTSTLILNHL